MKERLNKVFTVSAMSAIALTVLLGTGCKFTGGGYIPSASGIEGEKATVALMGRHDPNEPGEDNMTTVRIQYNDHGTGVRFHVNTETDSCADGCHLEPNAAEFAGEYCGQGQNGPRHLGEEACGIAFIQVLDIGEGQDPHGALRIVLEGGVYDGYYNEGLIQGNLQAH